MKFSHRAIFASVAMSLAAMVGVNAQATEVTATQDDTLTCIINGMVACFSGSQDEIQTCIEDVFTTCLGG